jgi:rSAM/selenodomain-associated transferase 1
VLALFAKAPIPGQVKTRLVPSLSAEQAAELYEAMLLDILDQHARSTGADLVLWYAPAESSEWFRARAPAAYRLLAQAGPDLASRMAHLFRFHASEGYDRIVLRGTDSPTLPAARVAEAFAALERVDLVLCPDRDGGYNAIGLRAPADALFDLELSRASVLDQTLLRAREARLRFELLEPHYDVDVPEDVLRLRRDVLADVSKGNTPRTSRWLRGLRDSIEA